jgi:hydroxypyruvate isomerase
MENKVTRRSALKNIVGSATLLGMTSLGTMNSPVQAQTPAKLKGNINHSVSRWCYNGIPEDTFYKESLAMGIKSVELMGEKSWAKLKEAGLVCAMCDGIDGIGYGFNRLDHHDKLIAGFEKAIPQIASFGFPNVICFSGNRGGMSDEEGMKNCVIGLKRLAPIAEKHKVTVCMELLNSKVDHKDYMCDRSDWGVEMLKQVGSEYCKLLFDIYHMQIMEGDIIRTIQKNHQYFGHYHTGGNPGRNEIDETQELNYPAIMKAIVATGYKGYVGQEFIPKKDPLTSLRAAIQLCDV